VQGTIHWVSARHALDCEARLYDRLFSIPDPDAVEEGKDFLSVLNPDSLVAVPNAKIEPSVAGDPPDTRYQFERAGYFMRDPIDSTASRLVFNRTVTLRDSWAKVKDRS
jgi:glutaminyl-tRNA synthetase